MKTVELICETCKKTFNRSAKEHKRNLKFNRRTFCSRKCVRGQTEHLEKYRGQFVKRLNSSNRQDEFSPFRRYMKTIRQRNHDFDVDLQYLKDLWEKQKGICPYTNLKMKLERNTVGKLDLPHHASLDRINSSKGYVKGNVEFICLFINFGKNGWNKDIIKDFLNSASTNKK